MDNNRNIDSFEQSLRNTLLGAEIAPSEQTWSRIEASLNSENIISPWRSFAKWSGAIAASVAIAITINLLFTPNTLQEPYEVLLSNSVFEKLESLPIALDPIKLSEPIFASAINQYDSTQETTEPLNTRSELEVIDTEKRAEENIAVDTENETTAEIEEQKQEPSSPTSQQVITSSSNTGVIDTKRILGKKRARRYATSATGAALLATGASFINFDGSLVTSSADYTNNNLTIFNPDDPTANTESSLQLSTTDKYDPIESSHSVPISYGISARYRLGKRWSLESGIKYTRLNSEITMSYSSQSQSQVVQFIGAPLRLNYDIFSAKGFSLYAGSGIQLDRCISAKLDSNKLYEKNWHISALGALGVQYKVYKWLGVYAEPEVGYYFTPTSLNTIRTENPLNFNLHFGIRMLLGEK